MRSTLFYWSTAPPLFQFAILSGFARFRIKGVRISEVLLYLIIWWRHILFYNFIKLMSLTAITGKADEEHWSSIVAESSWSYYNIYTVKFTATLNLFVYFISLVNLATAHGKIMQCQQKKELWSQIMAEISNNDFIDAVSKNWGGRLIWNKYATNSGLNATGFSNMWGWARMHAHCIYRNN